MKIHHPRDWYQFVRTVGQKISFHVIEMERTHFFDFKTLSKNKFIWRKYDYDGNKFSWWNVKWLRYCQNNFGIIEYKNTLIESKLFHKLNIKKRGINSTFPHIYQ